MREWGAPRSSILYASHPEVGPPAFGLRLGAYRSRLPNPPLAPSSSLFIKRNGQFFVRNPEVVDLLESLMGLTSTIIAGAWPADEITRWDRTPQRPHRPWFDLRNCSSWLYGPTTRTCRPYRGCTPQ